jgi:hypothetical protein
LVAGLYCLNIKHMSGQLRNGPPTSAGKTSRWKDVGVLEKLQTALHSRLFQPGPLSWRDDLVHTFDLWVMDRMPEAARTL